MDWQAILTDIPTTVAYVVIASVVAAASVLPLGWLVPAQTVAFLGGAFASTGALSLAVVALAVFGGAVVGCACGYGLGLLVPATLGFAAAPAPLGAGPPRRWHEPLARAWLRAADALRRHTAIAILAGRWNAALRACIPNAAGAARVGWWRFNLWNALACAIWAPVIVAVGTLAGRATLLAVGALGAVSLLAVGAIAAIVVAAVRRHARSVPEPVIPTYRGGGLGNPRQDGD